ncbi:MAG: tRNA pseudouridine synthase B [Bacteroidetes bacterium ADurb.Bin408]|nr:MAG: tRNA pseudouridine synthase B [Bacteroidetes bacterium ADurb.Bin408]
MTDKTYNFPEGEVLLFNKPYGWTSFDLVNKVRCQLKHFLKIKKIKIGHAGTLDPLATGLLILCTGKFTKQIERFQALEKEYTGTFYLGATTPSSDMESAVDEIYSVSHITENLIYEKAGQFIGEQLQAPPLFSAKKIEGERAYEYARRGEMRVMEKNSIYINTFEITGIKMPEVNFRVVCSKGTYIRSLARDFGEALGTGAYLRALCRIRIGEFKLEEAMELGEFEGMIGESRK